MFYIARINFITLCLRYFLSYIYIKYFLLLINVVIKLAFEKKGDYFVSELSLKKPIIPRFRLTMFDITKNFVTIPSLFTERF